MSAGWQGPTARRSDPEASVMRQTRLMSTLGAFLASGTTGNLERLQAAYDEMHAP